MGFKAWVSIAVLVGCLLSGQWVWSLWAWLIVVLTVLGPAVWSVLRVVFKSGPSDRG